MADPKLNRSLVLEAPARVEDGAGGFAETWQALGALWAEIKPRSGRERDREDVSAARMDYRITVRAVPTGQAGRPKAGQRFREGTRLFRILAVTERDAQARFLVCFATEEVSA